MSCHSILSPGHTCAGVIRGALPVYWRLISCSLRFSIDRCLLERPSGRHCHHSAPEWGQPYESCGKLNLQTPYVEERLKKKEEEEVRKPFKLILMVPGELKLCCKDLMIKGRLSQLAFIWRCTAAPGFLMSSCHQMGGGDRKISILVVGTPHLGSTSVCLERASVFMMLSSLGSQGVGAHKGVKNGKWSSVQGPGDLLPPLPFQQTDWFPIVSWSDYFKVLDK